MKPSFFIIGAPKSGTSSIDHYLAQHPQVKMAPKELHFFGRDLGVRQKELTMKEYQSHFAGQTAKHFGESSVWYLFSKNAAKEIHDFNPQAKIIAILREPIQFLESLHAQFLYDGDESEKDPNKAIFKSDFGRSVNFEYRPDYFEAASFGTQLQGYYDVFPKEQLHVILFEDLKEKPEEVFDQLLDFLELDDFSPDFEKKNQRKATRSAKLQQVLREKPSRMKQLGKLIFPNKAIRHKIMDLLDQLNRGGTAESISAENQDLIISKLSAEIDKIEALLGRELNWR